VDISILKKYDSQKMYEVYDKWPEIAQEAFESEQSVIHFDSINHIVFAGMGGSGAIGEIFASILSKSKIHVTVVKGYVLPKTVDKNTLVVTTSVSGNTVETLSVLESSTKVDCKIIAFSSGGKMKDVCLNKKIEYRNIPQLHSPRASFTNFLYSMLKTLEPIIPIKRIEVFESIKFLKEIREGSEVTGIGDKKTAPDDINVINPAFDMTPPELISGIITEKGVAKPPYEESIKKLFEAN